MSEEFDVLRSVINNLNNENISYMITGSFAANYYSVPRMTRDIDIVIELNSDDVEKLIKIFKDDFYIDSDVVIKAVDNQKMFNIIHNQTLIKIDFIVRKESEYRKLEFSRRQRVIMGNIDVSIVSAEDLIISKLFWAKESLSEIQLKDIKNLLEDVENIDSNYLEEWVKKLEIEDVYKEVKP